MDVGFAEAIWPDSEEFSQTLVQGSLVRTWQQVQLTKEKSEGRQVGLQTSEV